MSGAISSTSGGFPNLAEAIAASSQINQQLEKLTTQAASGYVSQTFAGLGGNASTALSLAPQISTLQAAQNNIDSANGALGVTQTAMTQIQSIASNLLAQLPNLNGLDPSEVDSVAANARDALSQLSGLLDTQYSDVYVFAGTDSANPPVPDPDQILTSGLYTQISAAVSNLSVNGAAATAAATLSIASSNAAGTSPFSTYLSQPAAAIALPSVATGGGQSQTVGLLASANVSVVSSGTSTTGSYMRDLMRALATIGSMSSSQVNDPNFASLVADTQTSLTGAITAMTTDVGVLGERQADLTTMQTNLGDTVTALTGQLSSAQDVDMAQTLSNLSLMQTRLQASYQLITTSSSMSLVKFLPTGG
jgi:flagellar hook-associated protein 3 FlgL